MNKEPPLESNDPNIKDNQMEKDRNISNFYPISGRDTTETRMNSNIVNLQNSAYKYLKSEKKPESANAFA
jgi:hypothetical protein